MRGEHAECVDERQRVHVSFVRDAQDQVEHPVHFSAGEVDREEHDFQALLMRVFRRFDGQVNRLFHGPLVCVLDDVLAGRNFHDHTLHAAIHGALDVVHHAARKGENFRAEVALHDILDGRGVTGRNHGHARFDAVHAGFGQSFGDADLVVLREDHAGLLFAVAQRHVVKLNLLRELKIGIYCGIKIPRAYEPLICLPRCIGHDDFLLMKLFYLRALANASGFTGLRGAWPERTRTTSSAAFVCNSSSDSTE